MKGKREELEYEIREKENDLKNEKSPDVFQNGFLVFLTILSYVILWFIRGMFGVDLRIFSLLFIGLLILFYLVKINKCNRLKEDIEVKRNELKLFLDNEKLIRENNDKRQQEKLERDKNRKQEELQILNKILEDKKEDFINEFDKDRNGELDITEGEDYGLLLKKYQQEIIKIDRDYVLKFVKLSNYLNTKRDNLRQIFKVLLRSKDEKTLEFINVTKNEIHSYNLILFNSLNMITSIVNDDMITFFEIYERFDMLNIFDSKHEKDLSNKLTTIGNNIIDLIYTMESIGENISNELSDLKYVTEESTRVLEEQLTSINSSIDTNNLLTTIQTYQMYKVNKNTKR